jgi:hypothetical protein
VAGPLNILDLPGVTLTSPPENPAFDDQQHRAIRLGNPATRFAPLTKADDLRVPRSDTMKADVAAIVG